MHAVYCGNVLVAAEVLLTSALLLLLVLLQEVVSAMCTLPEHQSLSLLRLNSRLGLTDGEATFKAIEQVRRNSTNTQLLHLN